MFILSYFLIAVSAVFSLSFKRVGVLCLCGQGGRLLFPELLQYVILGQHLLHKLRASSIIQPTTIVSHAIYALPAFAGVVIVTFLHHCHGASLHVHATTLVCSHSEAVHVSAFQYTPSNVLIFTTFWSSRESSLGRGKSLTVGV
jgi:hypothetical protein